MQLSDDVDCFNCISSNIRLFWCRDGLYGIFYRDTGGIIKQNMKVILSFFLALVMSVAVSAQGKSFYDFTVTTIDGKPYKLSQLKGHKVLVVNVASKCGLTPQYAELQELYDQYKDSGFIIIGFPANNFMGQEPGSNEEIAKFCTLNYDVPDDGEDFSERRRYGSALPMADGEKAEREARCSRSMEFPEVYDR